MAPSSSFASPVAGIGESLAGKEQLVSRAASSGHSRGDSGVSWHGEAHPDAAALCKAAWPLPPSNLPSPLDVFSREKQRGRRREKPLSKQPHALEQPLLQEKAPQPFGGLFPRSRNPRSGSLEAPGGIETPPDPVHAGCDPGISCQSRSRSWSRPHPHL